MRPLVSLKSPRGKQIQVTEKVARLLSSRGYKRSRGSPGPVLTPSGRPGRPLKVAVWVHRYPPIHNAGAEMMLHALLRSLAQHGHCVTVLAGADEAYELDGVSVLPEVLAPRRKEVIAAADVVVTHLDRTGETMSEAWLSGRPLVHLVHNDAQLGFWHVTPDLAQLAVMNSRWLYEEVGWQGPQIIVRPPVLEADYKVARPRAKATTLIGLSEPKGSRIFYEMARRLPDRPFIGVRGAYGRQEIPRRLPDNVEIVPHGPEIRAVYARTRVLLVPSSYESWGRVAIEAACSGIPVLAHPTPGLQESLGDAGIFCRREHPDEWEAALRRLEIPAEYAARSRRIRARARELEPSGDMELFERALDWVVQQRERTEV